MSKEFGQGRNFDRGGLQDAYENKTTKNTAAGMEQFESGDFKPFEGYDLAGSHNVFHALLIPTSDTVQSIQTSVISPLQEIAKKLNLPTIFAGQGDVPIHITLDIRNITGLTQEEREKAIDWMKQDYSHLQLITEIFRKPEFRLNRLVMAPNSYLATDFNNCQSVVYRARQLLEVIMNRSLQKTLPVGSQTAGRGFEPTFPYHDIFHSSICRVVESKNPAPSQNLVNFALEATETIGKSILETPIKVDIESVFVGTKYETIHPTNPNLLI